MRHSIWIFSLVASVATFAVETHDTWADGPKISPQAQEKLTRIVAKGVKYLKEKGQAEDGTFTGPAGPGLTALAVAAALRTGEPLDSPIVSKGLKALEANVKPDGGIYGNGRLRNYETCVAMLCFAEANRDGRYDELLKNAREFVTKLQYGPDAKVDPQDPWFGGVGYGGAGRPDLSNTSFLIEALIATGSSAEDQSVQRALVFVSRCQNLEGDGNNTQFAAKVNDGGFYYEIPREEVDPTQSPERFTANGGLRSYGSMTYAGLKSMIYAGLTKDDPRVIAAVEWIKNNYVVDRNPGMGDAGLYYYYHTFASALNAAELVTVEDAKGNASNWRERLIDELAKRQNEDGSWSNKNRRWLENDQNLATSFALMSLSYCQEKTP